MDLPWCSHYYCDSSPCSHLGHVQLHGQHSHLVHADGTHLGPGPNCAPRGAGETAGDFTRDWERQGGNSNGNSNCTQGKPVVYWNIPRFIMLYDLHGPILIGMFLAQGIPPVTLSHWWSPAFEDYQHPMMTHDPIYKVWNMILAASGQSICDEYHALFAT